MQLLFYTILVFIIHSTISADAFAYQSNDEEAVLYCSPSENTFMVRFGYIDSAESELSFKLQSIPSQYQSIYETLKLAETGSCLLQNENNITLINYAGQAFPYGAGGANPDQMFSLFMNSSPIFYKKTFYTGKTESAHHMSAILYKDGQIISCSNNQECHNLPTKLTEFALTQEEKERLAQDIKRELLESQLSSSCHWMRPQFNRVDNRLVGNEILEGTQWLHFSELKIDINNDLKIETVIRVASNADDCMGCGTHYFDGSYLLVFPEDFSREGELAEFYSHSDDGHEAVDAFLEKLSGRRISIGDTTPRYIYNVPFKSAAGETLVYSYHANVDFTPSAYISKINPDYSITKLCSFP